MMLTGTMCASARVVDEALIWWRGINDANGDGFVSADEIINARFPKNDSAHQGVTVSGSGTLRVVEEDVVSPWNGNTNRTPVLRLSNDGTETSIAFPVSKTTLSESIYALTFHIRCKWDGDFGPDTRGAVLRFQRTHGLTQDGVVGPKTRAALRKAVG